MKSQAYEESHLYKLRHTAAHLLAIAAKQFDPEVKLAIGPPIENGFYYDFDFSKPISHDDLKTLEKTIERLTKQNISVERKFLTHNEAIAKAKKENQPYKLELIENLPDNELSYYGIGDFWDLCKGPHVAKTGEVKAFKLLSLAGAYWRGDETQPMLTRIYGTAFENKDDLQKHLETLEEAKRRDHKKLGAQLDLFVFSDLVGAGLPLWTPKGTVIRELLDSFVWQLRHKHSYKKVEIPHLAKKELYEVSGHWQKFKDELFKIETREGHEYALKPMNCPHHTQIFKRKLRSYRDLPVRYANTTMVYRDEQSGELGGLSRVLSITQDDAHVFCRPDQVKEEISKIWSIINEFYGAFGFTPIPTLSFRDPAQQEKYLGSPEVWDKAEKQLTELVKEKHVEAPINIGEAAFYGPKIDFFAQDSLGRKWQVATVQLDMNMPKNFDLTYINENGNKEYVVMIHCAIMGSIERFISILIEHCAGEFPFWLAPTQVKVLPVSEKVINYAQEVNAELNKAGLRSELDESSETLGKKIRNGELEKVPYLLVIGPKEAEDRSVSVRVRHTPEQSVVKLSNFTESILRENRP